MNSFQSRFWSYYRLAKPGIIRGNAITALAGYVFASREVFSWVALIFLLVGSSLVIGSACVINNILDADIDKHMARTKTREMVIGALSTRDAWVYAYVLLVVGLAVLVLGTNLLTAALGVFAWVTYAFVYTASKRRTPHSTLIGTIPGAIPPVAGYAAARGRIDVLAMLLFAVLVCWQMPHFYAIALRRIDEYRAAKIPLLPIVKGISRTVLESRLYIAGFLVSILAVGIVADLPVGYFVGAALLGTGWLISVLRPSSVPSWPKQLFLGSLLTLLAFDVLISVWRAHS